MKEIDLATQTMFAELLQRSLDAEFDSAFHVERAKQCDIGVRGGAIKVDLTPLLAQCIEKRLIEIAFGERAAHELGR